MYLLYLDESGNENDPNLRVGERYSLRLWRRVAIFGVNRPLKKLPKIFVAVSICFFNAGTTKTGTHNVVY